MDRVIAQRIKALRLGLGGEKFHSYRAIAEACGISTNQSAMDGIEFVTVAASTLGEKASDWEAELEKKLGSTAIQHERFFR